MMYNFFRVGFLFSLLVLGACSEEEKDVPPNILLILADDLGYGDLGVYNPNSLVPTPNLDALAGEGVRLTRAYCPVAVCSPTRYALMTGRYPWRSWKKSGVMSNYEPSMIDAGLVTLPEMLQESGYTTAGFGKWHLGTTFPTLDGEQPAGYGKFRADDNGANLDLSQPVSDGPMDHGFDRWFGFSCASECWILDDNSIAAAIGHDLYTIEAAPNKENVEIIPLEDYLPRITDLSMDFLEDRAEKDEEEPFFLYFAPYVPHIPLAVSTDFRGSTEAGLYGDYVHELDHYLGILLNKLDELGMKDNTIVLFASDNGSQFEVTSLDMDLENASNSASDRLEDLGDSPKHLPNWPLRGTKWQIYEGGVRTPFIARWPGHFPAGIVREEMMGLNDLISTFADLLEYDGEGRKEMLDSKSMLSILEGDDAPSRDEIVVKASANLFGLVQGNWKYIGLGDYKRADPEGPAGELYDLSKDPGETLNIYNEHPDRAADMEARLEELLGQDVQFD